MNMNNLLKMTPSSAFQMKSILELAYNYEASLNYSNAQV